MIALHAFLIITQQLGLYTFFVQNTVMYWNVFPKQQTKNFDSKPVITFLLEFDQFYR